MTKNAKTLPDKQRIWFYVALFIMGLSLVNYFTSDGSEKKDEAAIEVPRIAVVHPRSVSLPPETTSTAPAETTSAALVPTEVAPRAGGAERNPFRFAR